MTARLLSLLLTALMLVAAPPARAQTSQEDVKATFVYRFASFISWPPGAFADPGSPVRLCVIGANPFARSLQRAVSGRRARDRVFEVRQVAGASDIDACHAVYVVGDRTDAVLRAAYRRPIVTITDGGRERGMIHFVLVEDRVRFYIDAAAAAESRLAIDPRLLNLALSVRRRASS